MRSSKHERKQLVKRWLNDELRWLYQISNKKKRYVGVLIFIQTLLGVSGVFYALFMREAIDGAVAGAGPTFFFYLYCIIGLVVLQITVRALERYLEEYLRSRLENTLKKRLYGQILCKDYADVTAVHSGEWMNRLTSDAVICANGIVDILPKLAGMFVKLCATFAMIVYIEPLFAWLLVPAGVVLILFTSLFRRMLKRQHKEVQEKDGKLRVFLQEHLSSLLVVKAFATEKESISGAEDRMEAHKKARMKRANFSNVCNVGFATLMNGFYLLGGVGYCGYGILTGTISYGTFTAMLQLMSQVQTPFANISGFVPRYYAVLASAERLMEAERFANDGMEERRTLQEARDYYCNPFVGIAFEDACFTYPKSNACEEMPIVLRDLSLELKKGDYIAFTGHSGCGKSTILKLLLALYPLDSGHCYLLESEGKVELTGAWRKLFAYVPQGNDLMCGTIREQVTYGNPTDMHEEERICKALQIACADKFVSELEDGIDTELGEKGQGLSEGQMQRLAIARAIFSDSPILLLDEATSALDEATEWKVLDNLKKMTDKTVIIVTHRMRALDICNKVARFTEDGVTIEET